MYLHSMYGFSISFQYRQRLWLVEWSFSVVNSQSFFEWFPLLEEREKQNENKKLRFLALLVSVREPSFFLHYQKIHTVSSLLPISRRRTDNLHRSSRNITFKSAMSGNISSFTATVRSPFSTNTDYKYQC